MDIPAWAWLIAIAALLGIILWRERRRQPSVTTNPDPPPEPLPRDEVFEQSAELLAIIARDGRVLDVNRAWLLQLGWLREEMIEVPVQEFIVPREAPRLHGALAAARRSERPETVEVELRSKTGVTKWYSILISRLPKGGHLLLSCRQFGHERQSLREIEKAKVAAQDQARAQRSFMATIGRDLRTPLHAITGSAGLLADSRLDSSQRELVGIVMRSTAQLTTTLDDVVDLSEILAETVRLDSGSFALSDCIDGALPVITSGALGKGIDVVIDIVDAPSHMVGDARRVRQVIVQLLQRAVHVTNEGSVILRAMIQDGRLHVAVRDHGPAMTPAEIDAAFRPFRRIHPIGLGLAIAKGLAEAMGGALEAQSGGEGTIFTLTIPFEEPPVPVAAHIPDVAGRRVLVVDDNEEARAVTTRLLANWGVEADGMGHGREALAKAREGQWDAILLEEDMPGIDGTEWTKSLGEGPPVILCNDSGNRPVGVGPCVAGVLAKPWRYRDLAEQLEAILAGREPQSAVPRGLAEEVPLRIVVAEDDHVNREVMRLLLERMGYRPIIVADGKHVLPALYGDPVDLVLMDIRMDGLDGLETARLIRRNRGIEQPIIIAMTAYARGEQGDDALEAGMDGLISKPVSIETIVDTLRDARRRIDAGRRSALPPQP